MREHIEVMTTTDSQEEARRIARALVESRLAACVQVIGPIESTYWWEGKMQQSEEWLCLIKTRADRYEEVEARVREVHSYDVPEVLALPVVAGHRPYLDWLDGELSFRT